MELKKHSKRLFKQLGIITLFVLYTLWLISCANYENIVASSKSEDRRIAAIKKITDQNILANIAINDEIQLDLRKLALQSITDQNILKEIAINSQIENVFREDALENITDQDFIKTMACSLDEIFILRAAALRLVEDQIFLRNYATNKDISPTLRKVAISSISNQDILKNFVLNGKFEVSIRESALYAITDQVLLYNIVMGNFILMEANDVDIPDDFAEKAIERMKDLDLLVNIAQNHFVYRISRTTAERVQCLRGSNICDMGSVIIYREIMNQLALFILDSRIVENYGIITIIYDSDHDHANYKSESTSSRLSASSTDRTIRMIDMNGKVILNQTYYSEPLLETEFFRAGTYSKSKVASIDYDEIKRKLLNLNDDNGITDLMVASSKGQTDLVISMLERGEDVNKKDIEGNTALIYALRDERFDIAKILLDNGANANDKTPEKRTALMIASAYGQLEIVKSLLIKEATINARGGRSGNTALIEAVKNSHLEIVNTLLDFGANINIKTSYGSPALLIAAEKGNKDIFELLIKNGAKLYNDFGNDALLLAAKNGNNDIIKLLLENGADVNIQDSYDNTPLPLAAKNRNYNTMELLLENGANVDSKLKDQTALMLVVWRGRSQPVKTLLKYNANVNIALENGITALDMANKSHSHSIAQLLINSGAQEGFISDSIEDAIIIAAEYGKLDNVEWLINNGANVNAWNFDGTALCMAARFGHLEVVDYLIKKGADVTLTGGNKFTPLTDAVNDQGRTSIARLLLENGADPNKFLPKSPGYKNQINPIILAVKYNNLPLVKLLIKHGANVNLKDSEGVGPMDYAIRYKYLDIKKVLIDAGARY